MVDRTDYTQRGGRLDRKEEKRVLIPARRRKTWRKGEIPIQNDWRAFCMMPT